MSRQSDLILFGPRLAIALASETASRISAGLRSVVRLRDSGSSASGERLAANAGVPAAEVEPAGVESEAPELEPNLAEIIPDVPQAVDGGFPGAGGKGSREHLSDPSPRRP
jgi:hypothetical protein